MLTNAIPNQKNVVTVKKREIIFVARLMYHRHVCLN